MDTADGPSVLTGGSGTGGGEERSRTPKGAEPAAVCGLGLSLRRGCVLVDARLKGAISYTGPVQWGKTPPLISRASQFLWKYRQRLFMVLTQG